MRSHDTVAIREEKTHQIHFPPPISQHL